MEERIINKIRKDKRLLRKLYNNIKSNVDIEADMVDSDTLLQLEIVSKIDEDLTDIIYEIFEMKNS